MKNFAPAFAITTITTIATIASRVTAGTGWARYDADWQEQGLRRCRFRFRFHFGGVSEANRGQDFPNDIRHEHGITNNWSYWPADAAHTYWTFDVSKTDTVWGTAAVINGVTQVTGQNHSSWAEKWALILNGRPNATLTSFVREVNQLLTVPIMTVYTLLIINKAGGLVYNRDFSPPANPSTQKISTNDYLVLAGTFHGVHAITKSLTPRIPITNPASSSASSRPNSNPNATITPSTASQPPPSQTATATTTTTPNPHLPSTGLETLESSFFRLTCFQTHTGTKFLLITDPLMPNVDAVMKGVYERYADHVMKNPFYQLEMPVRIEGWDRAINQWLGAR